MSGSVFNCSSCGADHGAPPFACDPSIVIVLVGPHKGKLGAAIEWRRYGGPTWVRVVVGIDEGGREIRVNFDPCQLKEWTP